MGEPVTLGTIIGGAAGGFIGGALPAWKGVKGSWFKNALGEITTNTVKGSFRGALAGMVGAVVDGKDITEGVANGIKNGALGGFSQSVAMVAGFGATRVLNDEDRKYIDLINEQRGTNYSYTTRRGGFINLLLTEKSLGGIVL